MADKITINTDKIEAFFKNIVTDDKKKQIVAYSLFGIGFVLLVIGILLL